MNMLINMPSALIPVQRLFLLAGLATLLALGSTASRAQSSTEGAKAPVAGRVMVAAGNVRAFDAQGKERRLEKGAEVRPGDRIVTEAGALAQVRMNDGGYLSIRPETELSIDAFVHHEKEASKSSFVMSLLKGGFRSITGLIGKTNPEGYKINAATATIGIRGTDHEPMLVLPPTGNAPILNPPGVYDKVNAGETFIRNERGVLALKAGQIGFTPVKPEVAPQIVVKVPDFYKVNVGAEGREPGKGQGDKSDEKSRHGDDKQSLRPTESKEVLTPAAGVSTLRPTTGTMSTRLRPTLIESPEGSKTEPLRTDTAIAPAPTGTLSPTPILTTTTIQPMRLDTTTSTTTLIAPTTTLTSPTRIESTTSTTTIQPTTTTTTTTILR